MNFSYRSNASQLVISRSWVLILACALLTALSLCPTSTAAEKPFEIGGLRIGSSVDDAQSRYPKMFFERTPYLDSEVEDRYKNFYGSVVIAEIKGSTGYEEKGGFVVLNTTFTGAGQLYLAQLSTRDANVNCKKLTSSLERQYGKAASQEADRFRLWRRGIIGDLQSLEFRCFQDGYSLVMKDHDAQADYLRKTKALLEPYVEQELQRLR